MESKKDNKLHFERSFLNLLNAIKKYWNKIIYLFALLLNLFRYLWRHKKILYIIPIVSLISISQNLSSRSQLEFYNFAGSGHAGIEKQKGNKIEYYEIYHYGVIKNRSKDKNTITQMNLMVFDDKDRCKYLSDRLAPTWMSDNRTDKKIKLPLIIEGREAIDITVYNKFYPKGSVDDALLSATVQISPNFYLPKYRYELTFTDINNNEFDQFGNLMNRDLINMTFILGNYCGDGRYKFWSCQIQKIKIAVCKFMFKIKIAFHWLGMENIGDSIYRLGTSFDKGY